MTIARLESHHGTTTGMTCSPKQVEQLMSSFSKQLVNIMTGKAMVTGDGPGAKGSKGKGKGKDNAKGKGKGKGHAQAQGNAAAKVKGGQWDKHKSIYTCPICYTDHASPDYVINIQTKGCRNKG